MATPGGRTTGRCSQRLVVSNAVLLLAACVLTVLVLAPRKFSSFALDEAIIVVVALGLVTLINAVVVHRFLAPLQALTALARRVDLGKPGQRIPDARPTSEAGELAVTFNEMLERLELERREATAPGARRARVRAAAHRPGTARRGWADIDRGAAPAEPTGAAPAGGL